MVRLKVKILARNRARLPLFQFLDGAIKRVFTDAVGRTRVMFQFLDGAIKSFFNIV